LGQGRQGGQGRSGQGSEGEGCGRQGRRGEGSEGEGCCGQSRQSGGGQGSQGEGWGRQGRESRSGQGSQGQGKGRYGGQPGRRRQGRTTQEVTVIQNDDKPRPRGRGFLVAQKTAPRHRESASTKVPLPKCITNPHLPLRYNEDDHRRASLRESDRRAPW